MSRLCTSHPPETGGLARRQSHCLLTNSLGSKPQRPPRGLGLLDAHTDTHTEPHTQTHSESLTHTDTLTRTHRDTDTPEHTHTVPRDGIRSC